MTIIRMEAINRLEAPTAVCLGFFDGVHIGHAALIKEAKRAALAKGLTVCAHTFDRMPSRQLHPGRSSPELTPLDEKAALLSRLGVEIVAVSRFDGAMMRMPPDVFFQTILMDKLRAAHIVIGFHHRFGYHGQADAETLRGYCETAGIGLSVVAPVTLADGTLVSSTAIRNLLETGETARAEAMLGRPYPVYHQKCLGREGT